jgi:putative addiction module component (TIGR02574 family)
MMQVKELEAAALELSDEEKSNLVSTILNSFDSPDPHDSDENSLTEAIRRGDEIRSGALAAIPEKEFMDEIRSLRF